VILAVVSDEETVIVSFDQSSVALPDASLGVIVKVADSDAETDADVALSVYEAGAPAAAQVTVVNGSPEIEEVAAPGPAFVLFVPLARLSNHTTYVMVATFVKVSAVKSKPVDVVLVSVLALTRAVLTAVEAVELSAGLVRDD